jgi:hypothetical protein
MSDTNQPYSPRFGFVHIKGLLLVAQQSSFTFLFLNANIRILIYDLLVMRMLSIPCLSRSLIVFGCLESHLNTLVIGENPHILFDGA